MNLDDFDYGDLLASLRKDLHLDASIDVLAGSVGQATINDGLVKNATSATAGAAGALPATPAGYLTFVDAKGVVRKIPWYNA